MRLYVTDADEKFPDIYSNYDITDNIEESTNVLILPGGLGALRDLFDALDNQKDILVYNRNMYYTSILNGLFKSQYVEEASLLNLDIESDYNKLIGKLEERKNGKTNDGKISKLL